MVTRFVGKFGVDCGASNMAGLGNGKKSGSQDSRVPRHSSISSLVYKINIETGMFCEMLRPFWKLKNSGKETQEERCFERKTFCCEIDCNVWKVKNFQMITEEKGKILKRENLSFCDVSGFFTILNWSNREQKTIERRSEYFLNMVGRVSLQKTISNKRYSVS